MDTTELLASAEARIQAQRTAEATLRFVDAAGQPLPHVEAEVRLTRHAFNLGANAFRLGNIPDPALQRGYDERFAGLLNFATLPFYWGGYEREPGRTDVTRLEQMADWCAQHRITTKGHPLAWHEVFPKWAGALSDAEVMARLQERVSAIVSHFRRRIDIWDVVNEATVSQNFKNTVGRWIARDGADACVAQALDWAHRANPDATLLYNDFNIAPAFEQLCAGLIARRAPVHTIGIQSHMHKGTWPIERLWSVCETYARFGLPLHFTELTVLSGALKGPDDNDWHARHTDWLTSAEGEAAQLEYGRQLYTLLFSHPAVEAITWWDFSDLGSWQGAPAGLVRQDMTPKPLYDWLVDAFQRQWTTQARLVADERGRASLRAFFGDYEVTAHTAGGATLRGTCSLPRHGEHTLTVTLS